jgi:uncharacterized 2Fe-2S/4Fe-4S cluster protein (DUF4445 family)
VKTTSDKCTITFYPDAKKIEVSKGEEILDAALACGIYLNSVCGGDGVCGKCKVIVKKGRVKTEPSAKLSAEERKHGYVLACQSTVDEDVEIEIPQGSRMDLGKVSGQEERLARLKDFYSQAEEVAPAKEILKKEFFHHSPLATKLFLKLPPPTLQDNISDLDRLLREIKKKQTSAPMQTGLSNIKQLGSLLRKADWQVTVTLGKRNETTEIVLIEPGDTTKENYGLAFDIGTTTVVGELINLNSKAVLGTKATHNQQAVFGSDVISRIIYASEKGGLDKLHQAVIGNVNGIIEELVKEHNVSLENINAINCAGNTTMVHLLLRIEPAHIRKEPYTPTANFLPVIRAAEAGIKINPRGLLACVPGVSTYVGGDLTAGVLATGLDQSEKLTLLIDIGTNGEIALGNKEWIVSSACSAGPAFEGSGISCGMRAASGAIQRVKISKEKKVEISTIGNAKPRGICGSGMIDALAELLHHGIIDRQGKINRPAFPERIEEGAHGLEFILSPAQESETGEPIVLAEADIANIIRSKAAIYSGVSILLRRLGLDFNRIDKVFIAGRFGTYLDIQKAIAIGLLADLPIEKFKFVGNTSLVGSREILLSYEAMEKAKEIAQKITYFELSVEPGYMEEYISALFLPHTDLNRFKNLK